MAETDLRATELKTYTMAHCNEFGDDYSNRCYIVAEPSDGSDSLMARGEKWVRVSDVSAALAAVQQETQAECSPWMQHDTDCSKYVEYADEMAGCWFDDTRPCSCGLTMALSAHRKPKEDAARPASPPLRDRIERLAQQWGDDGAHGSELRKVLDDVV